MIIHVALYDISKKEMGAMFWRRKRRISKKRLKELLEFKYERELNERFEDLIHIVASNYRSNVRQFANICCVPSCKNCDNNCEQCTENFFRAELEKSIERREEERRKERLERKRAV